MFPKSLYVKTGKVWYIMGFGAYSEDEHERREQKKEVKPSAEPLENQHDGKVTTEGADDTEALLDGLADMKGD